MSTGNIYFLGENATFLVKVDQIYARDEIASAMLHIPYIIKITSFRGNRGAENSYAETIISKAELRTKDSNIKLSEAVSLSKYILSRQVLSYDSEFNFAINSNAIHKLENYRKGDISFSMAVSMQAAICEQSVFNGSQRTFVSNFDRGSGHVDFEIPQSQWVKKILPGTGHKSFTLIELPASSQLIPAIYTRSLNELELARKYFIDGDYDKTVAHCRGAIDPFKTIKGQLRTFIKSKSELTWVNEVMDATEAWINALVRSTFTFTSKAHHAPSTGHFDRSDAEIIMMVTTALVAYIGKLEGNPVT